MQKKDGDTREVFVSPGKPFGRMWPVEETASGFARQEERMSVRLGEGGGQEGRSTRSQHLEDHA